MNCVHCANAVGEIYTHHQKGVQSCYHCGSIINPQDYKVRYLGITQIDNNFVHLYKHVAPIVCTGCSILLSECFYDCSDDGAIIDLKEVMQRMHEA